MTHTFWFDASYPSGYMKLQTRNRMVHYKNETDLTTTELSNYDASVDVLLLDDDLTGMTFGVVDCADVLSGAKCDRHTLTYDIDFAQSQNLNTDQKRYLACHEIGHTLGLKHGDDAAPRVDNDKLWLGCLTTPLSNPNALTVTGGHNKEVINDNY